MATGRFHVLEVHDDSSDTDEDDISFSSYTSVDNNVVIPMYEDLSVTRADEETVLAAVYGNDFTREGRGSRASSQLKVHCRPPDTEKVWCALT
jgi:hypothetical protein